MPIPDGDWQEYLLLGASLGMAFIALKEQMVFKNTASSQAIAAMVIFWGIYGFIFYIQSDWSMLEIASLVLLCLPSLINFVRVLMGTKS
jgi:uncharacterized membrane protein